MQRERAQGLCFSCNEQFTLGYHCRQPQVLLLEVNDEEEIEIGASKVPQSQEG